MENPDDLPSVEEFLEEKTLPSVNDFLSKPEEKEIVEEEVIEEPTEEKQDLTEVLRLINDVRRDIPDVPEIKYYDEELKEICERISQIQEEYAKADTDLVLQNEELESKLENIESKIPTVKYYDHDINEIQDKIVGIKEELNNLPEVRYYEQDLDSLKARIEQVNESIPTFPDWVQEVQEVPDFSWIGKTFSLIDDDFNKVQGHLDVIREKIDFQVNELNDTVEKKEFELKVDVKNLTEHFDKTVENLEETKDKLLKQVKDVSQRIWEQHHVSKDDDRKLKKSILGEQNKLKQLLLDEISNIDQQSVKAGELILKVFTDLSENVQKQFAALPEVKYYDEDVTRIDSDITSLREELKELSKIANRIKVEQKNLQENYLLNEPPETPENTGSGQDPLTPLDQKFATLDDLSAHYRLFINRVTTQLATMGGGGAAFVRDLDDVEFDATEGNNKLLIYNSSVNRWVGIDSNKIGNVGAAGTWGIDPVGIHTVKNVGIGTTAVSDKALYVLGDGQFTGNLAVGGTITYDDVKRVDSLGLSTFRSGLEVNTGSATTALLVRGDARITGILTIGTASITIDGDNNIINTGIVTITSSSVTIGDNVTINAGATGINSAPNVFYVAKDGNDDNNGTSIDNAKLTIASAVGVAQSGSVIKVLSGNYVESNPISVPAFVAIVGDDQRTVKVLPSNTTQDLFHVRKGCKLANMTFSGHLAPSAAVAFPPTGATNVGGGKWKGPYVQNCTSDTTTGTGIRVDGRLAPKTKSMNVDAFTQYNQGGVGVAVTNEGYAQLVSLFTICCDSAIQCHAGGQADVANSNCSFGTKGLTADGKSPEKYVGVVSTSAASGQDNIVVDISQSSKNVSDFDYTHTTGIATVTTSTAHGFIVGSDVRLANLTLSCSSGNKTYPDKDFVYQVTEVVSTTKFKINAGISTLAHSYVSGGTAIIEAVRPYDGQVVYFDQLYKSVESITITNGGSGYTSTPSVTIASPSGPNGEVATAFATLEGDSVTSITIISSGSQYTSTPSVTITAPDSGVTATGTAVMEDTYYTINSSTPVTSGITTLTLAENLLNTVGVASTAYFYQQSKIIASSHTFEYVGSGNDITAATPKRGGVTIEANEVVSQNGGRVIYTSTDQAGNFKIGDDFQINQATGTVSGRAFSKSLFSEMTPFILALS